MIKPIVQNIFAIYDKRSYIQIPFYFLRHKKGNILIGVSNNFREELVKEIKNLGKITYIYITHFHADFPVDVCRYKKALNAKIIVHKNDANYISCKVEGVFTRDFKLYKDVEILYTPGHTKGNSMLYSKSGKGVLFSGDAICVDTNGKPLMLKHYTKNPVPLSNLDRERIIKKLKVRNWNVMLSHWGIIQKNAKKKFMDRYG